MGIRFGRLGETAAHLCIDMQTMFAERTDWHVPWMQRVLPAVQRLAHAKAEQTIFTRFVPPDHPGQANGTWQRYYRRWRHMTGERIDPAMIDLVPPLCAVVPPATVIDKFHYSPFTEQTLPDLLRQRGVDTLVITGSETDVCVLAAVLDAVDRGYRVIVAADALCSVSDEAHDSLLALYGKRFGQQIEVSDTEEILDAWN
ncbi:MAG TPA: isochorismatase family cysteine hydrolase [Acetobacteraceae bacterium]